MSGMPLEKSPTRTPAGRIAELADQCVQCGLCLHVCPTYALDQNEAESPRGRIAMASALARGLIDPTAELRAHLDHCLGCLSCEKVCPAHVQYDELLIQTRSMLGPDKQRPRWLLGVLRRPRLLRWLQRFADVIALPRWKGSLAARLPAASALRSALLNLPSSPSPASARLVLTKNNTEGQTVALFPGCVASVMDAQAQQSAIELLKHVGYQVSVLPAFCCGAMDLHGGASAAAEQLAAQVREAWAKSGATLLVSVTPGCIGTLRRALPGVEVVDPVQLLAGRADALRFRPLAQRIALHLPCTQVNVARSDAALIALLRRVPDLEVMPLPRPPYCCGAAGTHMLEFPARAAKLREGTLDRITALAPQQLLSSNIGCRLHLAAGLDEQGHTLAQQHPLSLLAQQLESTNP